MHACMYVCVCECMMVVWFYGTLFLLYTAQATMVRHMSEGQVARYKERAVADMRMNKRTYIRCPC
jgi:hypothetical protein